MADKRFVKLLKNQNSCRGRPTLYLDVLSWRKVNVTTCLEPVFSFVDENAGLAVDHVNKKLVSSGVPLALAVAVEGDKDLREARAHGGRNEDVADCLLRAREIAVNESAGCKQCV